MSQFLKGSTRGFVMKFRFHDLWNVLGTNTFVNICGVFREKEYDVKTLEIYVFIVNI
jgi:hypothetical protein